MANPKNETQSVEAMGDRLTDAAERIGSTEEAVKARQDEQEQQRRDAEKNAAADQKAADEAKSEAAKAAKAAAARKENAFALTKDAPVAKARTGGSRNAAETPEEAQARKDAMAEMLQKEKEEAAARSAKTEEALAGVKEAGSNPPPAAPAPAPEEFPKDEDAEQAETDAAEETAEVPEEDAVEDVGGDDAAEPDDAPEDAFDDDLPFDVEDLFDDDELDALLGNTAPAPDDDDDFAEEPLSAVAAPAKAPAAQKDDVPWQSLLETYLNYNAQAQKENIGAIREIVESALRTIGENNLATVQAITDAIGANAAKAPAEPDNKSQIVTVTENAPSDDVLRALAKAVADENQATRDELARIADNRYGSYGDDALDELVRLLRNKSAEELKAEFENADVLEKLAEAIRANNMEHADVIAAIAAEKNPGATSNAMRDLIDALKESRADRVTEIAAVTAETKPALADASLRELTAAIRESYTAPSEGTIDALLAALSSENPEEGIAALTKAIRLSDAREKDAVTALAVALKSDSAPSTVAALTTALKPGKTEIRYTDLPHALANALRCDYPSETIRRLTDAIKEVPAENSKNVTLRLAAALKKNAPVMTIVSLVYDLKRANAVPTEESLAAFGVTVKENVTPENGAALSDVLKNRTTVPGSDRIAALALALRDFATFEGTAAFIKAARGKVTSEREIAKLADVLANSSSAKTCAALDEALRNSDILITDAAVADLTAALKATKSGTSQNAIALLSEALKANSSEQSVAAFLEALRGDIVRPSAMEISELAAALRDDTAGRINVILERALRDNDTAPKDEMLVALADALCEKPTSVSDDTIVALASALKSTVTDHACASFVDALLPKTRISTAEEIAASAETFVGDGSMKLADALKDAFAGNTSAPAETTVRALTTALLDPDVQPAGKVVLPAAPDPDSVLFDSGEYRIRIAVLLARLSELERQRDSLFALRRSGTADERYTRSVDKMRTQCAILDTIAALILASSAAGKYCRMRKYCRMMRREILLFNKMARKERRALGFRPKALNRVMPKQIVAENTYTPLSRSARDPELEEAIKALAVETGESTSDEGLFGAGIYAASLKKRVLSRRERRYNERNFRRFRRPLERRLNKLRAERDKRYRAGAALLGEARVDSDLLLLTKQAEIVNISLSIAREAFLFSLTGRLTECGAVAAGEISTYNNYLESFNALTGRTFVPVSDVLVDKVKDTGSYTPVRPIPYRKEDYFFDQKVRDCAADREAARAKHTDLLSSIAALDASNSLQQDHIIGLRLEAVACAKVLCDSSFALLETAAIYDLKEAKAKWALEAASEIEMYNDDVLALEAILGTDFFKIDPRVIGNIVRLEGTPIIPTLVWGNTEGYTAPSVVTRESRSFRRYERRRERRIARLMRRYARAAKREERVSAKEHPNYARLDRLYRIIMPCLGEIVNIRFRLLRRACRLKLEYMVEVHDRKTRAAIALYNKYVPSLIAVYDEEIPEADAGVISVIENGFRYTPLENIYEVMSLRPLTRADRFRKDHREMIDEISTLRLERDIRVGETSSSDRVSAVGAAIDTVNLTVDIADRLVILSESARAFRLRRYRKMYASDAKEELGLYNLYVSTLNDLASKAFPTVPKRVVRRIRRHGLDAAPYRLDYTKERFAFELFLSETEPKLDAAVAARESAKASLYRVKAKAKTYNDRLHFTIAAVAAGTDVVNLCYVIAERAYAAHITDYAEIYSARILVEWDEYDHLITGFNALAGEDFPLVDRTTLDRIREGKFYLPIPEFNYERQLAFEAFVATRKPVLDQHHENIEYLQKQCAKKRGKRALPLLVAMVADSRVIANTYLEILDKAAEYKLADRVTEYSISSEYAIDTYNSFLYRVRSLTREDLPAADKAIIEDIKARRMYRPIPEIGIMNDLPLPGKYTGRKERRFIRFAAPQRKKITRLRKKREALREKEASKSGKRLLKLDVRILALQRQICNRLFDVLDHAAALKLYEYNESYCLECENEIDLYNEYIGKINLLTGNDYPVADMAVPQAILDRHGYRFIEELDVTFSHTVKETVEITDTFERNDIALIRARRSCALLASNRELYNVCTDYTTDKTYKKAKKKKDRITERLDETNSSFDRAEAAERADNSRYFKILRCDVDEAVFKRKKADRGILGKYRDRMRALLKERDALNQKLIALYEGSDGTASGVNDAAVNEVFRNAEMVSAFDQREIIDEVRDMRISDAEKRRIIKLLNYKKSLVAEIEANEFKSTNSNLHGAAAAQLREHLRGKRRELRKVNRRLARVRGTAERREAAERRRPWIIALIVIVVIGAAAAIVYYGFWPQITNFFANLFGKSGT